MKDFNRKLLTRDEFNSIKNALLSAFKEFTPRSHFIAKNKAIENHNIKALDKSEQPNILSNPTTCAPHLIPNIDSFYHVFKHTPIFDLLVDKFKWVDEYVSLNINGCKNSFITFSTNITGAKIGVKHVHSLLNGDSCNVYSFAVPLYIDNDCDHNANFWYNSQENLFPARYYIDYERIKKLNIQYTNIGLPRDGKILSFKFDGARSPHYIDYTNHLYAFLVFDGIDIGNEKLGKKFITELL